MKKAIEKVGIFILIIILVILVYIVVKPYFGIDKGDKVKVDYSLYVDDKLYETTIIEDAKEAGIFDEAKLYKPLEFVIGSGSVLKKFEDAVKGMNINEEKIITLSPSEAYGDLDEKKIVRDLKRRIVINKTSSIDLESFRAMFAKDPVLNEFVKDINFPWEFKILAIENSVVYVENILEKGEKIVLPGSEWDSIVEDIDNNKITIMQYPEIGDSLIIPGEFILRARVIDVKNSGFDVDLNHPLAGKTLRFKIILIDIKK